MKPEKKVIWSAEFDGFTVYQTTNEEKNRVGRTIDVIEVITVQKHNFVTLFTW